MQARRPWGDNSFGHGRDCPSNSFKALSNAHCQELMVLGAGAPLHQLRKAFLHSHGLIWSCYQKKTKKPLVWAQLFHTKLHYYSSSHPWNSGKKTRRRLQATLAPCFLARPSIQPNIRANRRARRLRQVAIQASISPVTQSFQPTQWTASTNHPRQEPLCLPWLQRRAGKTRPARLSLAPPNTQQREWLRKHAETGIITGKEAGSLDSLKR